MAVRLAVARVSAWVARDVLVATGGGVLTAALEGVPVGLETGDAVAERLATAAARSERRVECAGEDVAVLGMSAGRAVGVAADANRAAAEPAPCEELPELMPRATTAQPATVSDAVTEATARPRVMRPL